MDLYRYKRFCTDSENLRDTIERYGVAIIPNVLDTTECEKMVDGIWDFFQHISSKWDTPIDRDDDKTWRGFYSLLPLHSMLFQHWGVGHSQVTWDLRQHPKILAIFSTLWGTKPEELLVSFDGLSFNPPPERTNRGWNRKNTWYHTDQSFTRNDFECVQSWVTGLDIEKGDATLSFYRGSNRLHKEFAAFFNKSDKTNWYKLSKEEEAFFSKRCKETKIMCPKGSMVFFDSRTIHCGTEAFRERKHEKFRAVVYLCYQPRSKASEAQLRKKRKAFEEMRMTTHWPADVRLFAKNPRTYGNPIPIISEIERPQVSEIGMKLAGF